uniref:Glutaredoxin domain-containing protein n=1 Tax=Strigamia maritima TaxID=126957 RepID=T1IVN5_STRMM
MFLMTNLRNVFQKYSNFLTRRHSTVSRNLPSRKSLIYSTLGVVGLGVGGAWYLMRPKSFGKSPTQIPINVTPSRSVTFASDHRGLKLTLYQYQTCPFCCKVRAFLNYHGISYNVVEVNPVLRQQIKFSDWKKVPIIIAEDKTGVRQLNDSSMIISSLQTWLRDCGQSLDDIIPNYTALKYKNDKGQEISEIVNRYFVMFGEMPLDQTQHKYLALERKWRMWADDVLVHTISPNIYRSFNESLDSFRWFSEVGNWKEYFNSFERYFVIYLGAAAMYFIGQRLKKRHGLKNDVRESLYDACREWMREVGRKPFRGGLTPDLSDLAVFGVLNSMEGLQAFEDAKAKTKIGEWYDRMQYEINSNNQTATAISTV